jgi:hypothetical protein
MAHGISVGSHDVLNGLVSERTASDVYGVVIDGESRRLDFAATQKLRAMLSEERVTGVSL